MLSFHLEIQQSPQQGDGCQVTEWRKRHGLEKVRTRRAFSG